MERLRQRLRCKSDGKTTVVALVVVMIGSMICERQWM